MTKRLSWTLLGLLISLACLAMLFGRVSLADCWGELSKVSFAALLAPTAVALVFYPLRPLRWQMLFPPGHRPRFAPCFFVLSACNLVNNLVPARGGDLLRCILIGRQQPAGGASAALATVAVEKIFDGLALAALLEVAVMLLGPPDWVASAALAAGCVFLAALAIVVLLKVRPTWLPGGVSWSLTRMGLPRLGEALRGVLQRFVAGLAILASPGQVVVAALLTVAIWLADAGVTWGLAHGLGAPLSFGAAAVVSAIIGLSFMIPAAPANVGTYEVSAVAALRLFGIAAEQAVAVALVLHAWTFLLNTVLGVFCLAPAGASLVGRAAEPPRTAEADAPAKWTPSCNTTDVLS
jgi:uncharacterized protein (TIRG00374 family)